MSGSTNSFGLTLYKLGFEISPVILVQGLASEIDSDLLPIVALIEPINLINGFITGSPDTSLDNYFAHFQPQTGGTLIDFEIGAYPFANQAIAANSLISNPLRISMIMKTPINKPGGYAAKFATFMALQAALTQHAALGGWYSIVTPAYLYTNCILLRMSDISDQSSKQAMNTWQLEFVQPLISQNQAAAAQNSLMSKITNALKIDGQPALSGPGLAANPAAAPGFAPGAANLTGTNVGGAVSSAFPPGFPG